MDLAPFAREWTQCIFRLGFLIGGFDSVEYALIIILLAGVTTLAILPGRSWSSTPIFCGAVFASFFLVRLPWFLPVLPNPDEAQMLAGTERLLKDPVFWRSVDGTTVGPLDYVVLLFLKLLGLPLNFATARFANVVMLWAAMLFLYLAARFVLPEWAARLSILPVLAAMMQPRSSSYSDFIHYASECVPVALTACCVWQLARCTSVVPEKPLAWVLFGITAACLPFAKLQTVPIAALLLAAGVASALTNPKGRDWRSVIWLNGGALLVGVLALCILAIAGAIRDFYESYVVNNVGYTTRAVTVWTPGSFAEFVFKTPEMSRFLWGAGVFICLIGGYALWRRTARVSAASWFAIGLLAASIYAIWLPGRSFPHYLFLLFVPVGLIAILALSWAVQERARLAGAIFTVLVIGFPTFGAMSDRGESMAFLATLPATPEVPVARRLSQLVHRGDSVVVWGWIPELYVMTGTVPGTREAQTERQLLVGPQQEYYRKRFLRDLEAKPPKVFVDAVGLNQTIAGVKVLPYESFPELRDYVDSHYELSDSIQDCRLFVRRGAIVPPPGKPAEVPLTLRAGGAPIVDAQGQRWRGDDFYFGGATREFRAVSNGSQPALPPIYLAERYCPDSCEYLIPVPDGSYAVRLYFVELLYGARGARLFDVTVNGAPALASLDIFSESGGIGVPVIREVRTVARDGAIRVGLLPKVREAKINAIEIRPMSSGESE